jgi:IS1 family transposase
MASEHPVGIAVLKIWCIMGKRQWVWLALCQQARQVVGFTIGNRSAMTCHQLWNAVPIPYRQGMCYSGFWEAFQAVIPDE